MRCISVNFQHIDNMLTVTPQAMEKLKEVLEEQTTDQRMAIRVTSSPLAPNPVRFGSGQRKKRRSSSEKRRGYKDIAYTV